jgi:hypothetical protein
LYGNFQRQSIRNHSFTDIDMATVNRSSSEGVPQSF